MSDRTETIEIGGQEFELALTLSAIKEIAKKFGGLENLGDKLYKPESFDASVDTITWLVVLLANQGIQIHNYKNKENPENLREEITPEFVEMFLDIRDFWKIKDVVSGAMIKGMKRNVESEDDGKNVVGG